MLDRFKVPKEDEVKVSESALRKTVQEIFAKTGLSKEDSQNGAEVLVTADLRGVESHGVSNMLRIYVQLFEQGELNKTPNLTVIKETPGTATIDADRALGIMAGVPAMERAISKARNVGVGIVTMFNSGHMGAVGHFSMMAAQQDMVGMCSVAAGTGILPTFGAEPKLGTNPISYTFPSDEEGPILLDMATSVGAEGKLRVYRARGHDLPDKWVLDSEGNPSENPNDFYEGGAILPVGGLAGGHKGFGLGMVATILGAVMAETGDDSEGTGSIYDGGDGGINGSTVIAINAEALGPIDETKKRISNFVKFLKDVEPMDGSEGVLYPGEVEIRNRVNKRASGVEIEDATWNQVCELIDEYNVRAELEPLPN